MITFGDPYWLVDVDMDCNTTINGWFEFKSYISNGPAWVNSITQTNFFGLTPPSYQSGNRFAYCGMVNVFERNSNNPVDIKPFTTAN